ncbi:tail fiber domain-containing protein, partial [bacterium]|nr:tail fiber domain-containing protein [bacterium]
WKETGKSSYGVIAQELQKVLPELVKQGEVKSVNYNGIIGVLIEAIKELKNEVRELKNLIV